MTISNILCSISQDLGEFNIATSSLHALSNSMCRAEKPSPHSSPRMSRRSVTPSVNASAAAIVSIQNEIYSTHQQPSAATTASPASSLQQQISTAPSMQSINGSQQQQQQHQLINSNNNYNSNNKSSSNISKQATASDSTSTSSNRMSAPLSSAAASHVIQNKVLNKALSADLNDISSLYSTSSSSSSSSSAIYHPTDQTVAPPLPPRKSSPSIDSTVNRQLKPIAAASVTSASSLVNLSANTSINSSLSRSSENITSCEFNVPKSVAPPVPKHNVIMPTAPPQLPASNKIPTHSIPIVDNNDLDKVIVGPAETISGIIDTRPLENRKPIVSLESNSRSNEINNLYQMKVNNSSHQLQQQQNHQRHQSFPNSSTTSMTAQVAATTTASTTTTFTRTTPCKSITTPSFAAHELSNCNNVNNISSSSSGSNNSNNSNGSGCCSSNSSSNNKRGVLMAGKKSPPPPLLYENVTITSKDCNVPYENINLEYIARLMNEGYSKEHVVTALGISRNNIEMACDILHEFVSKNGA